MLEANIDNLDMASEMLIQRRVDRLKLMKQKITELGSDDKLAELLSLMVSQQNEAIIDGLQQAKLALYFVKTNAPSDFSQIFSTVDSIIDKFIHLEEQILKDQERIWGDN